MSEKAKGIGLFGLIGMVVSSCIGSGVFAITGQLAGVASPGAVLVAWAVVGIGFADFQSDGRGDVARAEAQCVSARLAV